MEKSVRRHFPVSGGVEALSQHPNAQKRAIRNTGVAIAEQTGRKERNNASVTNSAFEMQKRTLAFVAMGMAAIVLVVLSTGLLQQKDYASMDYPEVRVPIDRVHTLQVKSADSDVVLNKDGDRWQLTRPIIFPVETPRVDAILRRLEYLELDTMVTAEPSRYDEFGVTEVAGRELTVKWDGGSQRIVIAGLDENYQSDYVRIGDDPRVFFIAPRFIVDDDVTSWKDKRIAAFDRDSIRSIAVEGSDRGYKLVKADDGRISTESGALPNLTIADRLFLQYSMLRADGFSDGADPDGVRESPTVVVRIGTSDGESAIYFRDAGAYFDVVADGIPGVFSIAAARLPFVAPTLDRVMEP